MLNFMISLLGWFLWNWAEFSLAKQDGDGSEYSAGLLRVVNECPGLSDHQKEFLTVGIKGILKAPVNLIMYAKTHYETWIGSLGCIALLLWVGYRQLNIDPFASMIGINSGWNDLYLIGSGAAWDALIFVFKKIKKFFKNKESEL